MPPSGKRRRSRGRTIEVGAQPLAAAIAPGGRTANVVSFGSGTVTPIATATNRPGKPIRVGRGFATVITR
jgi:hypothetical protein